MSQQRRNRPGGLSWSQTIAPGATIQSRPIVAPSGRPRTVETQQIIDWLRTHPPATTHEIHDALFRATRLTWTPGYTGSRLGSLVHQGWLRRIPGGFFTISENTPP